MVKGQGHDDLQQYDSGGGRGIAVLQKYILFNSVIVCYSFHFGQV